jgi:hypothetical protein
MLWATLIISELYSNMMWVFANYDQRDMKVSVPYHLISGQQKADSPYAKLNSYF